MCECGHSVEDHDQMTRRCRNVDCDCKHMRFWFRNLDNHENCTQYLGKCIGLHCPRCGKGVGGQGHDC